MQLELFREITGSLVTPTKWMSEIKEDPTIPELSEAWWECVGIRQRRFAHLLSLIESVVFSAVPFQCTNGVLLLTVPFCGDFYEAPVLVGFLQRLLDTRTDLRRVSVLLADIEMPAFARGVPGSISDCLLDARISFPLMQCDLSVHELPRCHLLLGLQPAVSEASQMDMWSKIILQCTKAANLAIFTTLSMTEAFFVCNIANSLPRTQARFFAGVPCEPREAPIIKRHYGCELDNTAANIMMLGSNRLRSYEGDMYSFVAVACAGPL